MSAEDQATSGGSRLRAAARRRPAKRKRFSSSSKPKPTGPPCPGPCEDGVATNTINSQLTTKPSDTKFCRNCVWWARRCFGHEPGQPHIHGPDDVPELCATRRRGYVFSNGATLLPGRMSGDVPAPKPKVKKKKRVSKGSQQGHKKKKARRATKANKGPSVETRCGAGVGAGAGAGCGLDGPCVVRVGVSRSQGQSGAIRPRAASAEPSSPTIVAPHRAPRSLVVAMTPRIADDLGDLAPTDLEHFASVLGLEDSSETCLDWHVASSVCVSGRPISASQMIVDDDDADGDVDMHKLTSAQSALEAARAAAVAGLPHHDGQLACGRAARPTATLSTLASGCGAGPLSSYDKGRTWAVTDASGDWASEQLDLDAAAATHVPLQVELAWPGHDAGSWV